MLFSHYWGCHKSIMKPLLANFMSHNILQRATILIKWKGMYPITKAGWHSVMEQNTARSES